MIHFINQTILMTRNKSLKYLALTLVHTQWEDMILYVNQMCLMCWSTTSLINKRAPEDSSRSLLMGCWYIVYFEVIKAHLRIPF
jgi:hypothetical protein